MNCLPFKNVFFYASYFLNSLLFHLLKILGLFFYHLFVIIRPLSSKYIIWTQILYAVG